MNPRCPKGRLAACCMPGPNSGERGAAVGVLHVSLPLGNSPWIVYIILRGRSHAQGDGHGARVTVRSEYSAVRKSSIDIPSQVAYNEIRGQTPRVASPRTRTARAQV